MLLNRKCTYFPASLQGFQKRLNFQVLYSTADPDLHQDDTVEEHN